MAQAVLSFNEQLERIAELAIVALVGAMLAGSYLPPESLWLVPLLLLVIRPLAVWLGLAGRRVQRVQRGLIMWFGIRGIGSLYYLMFAIAHGLLRELAARLTATTDSVIAVSIVAHGISVAPLMRHYAARRERKRWEAARRGDVRRDRGRIARLIGVRVVPRRPGPRRGLVRAGGRRRRMAASHL